MSDPANRRETAGEDTTGETRESVEIPTRLSAAIERRLPATNFESTDEYVSFALASLLRELDRQSGTPADPDQTAESDDSPRVQSRLESLGYL